MSLFCSNYLLVPLWLLGGKIYIYIFLPWVSRVSMTPRLNDSKISFWFIYSQCHSRRSRKTRLSTFLPLPAIQVFIVFVFQVCCLPQTLLSGPLTLLPCAENLTIFKASFILCLPVTWWRITYTFFFPAKWDFVSLPARPYAHSAVALSCSSLYLLRYLARDMNIWKIM